MKRILKHFPLVTFSVLPVTVVIFCGWHQPENNYSNKGGVNINQRDTIPKKYQEDEIDMQAFDKAMKELDVNMANIDEQMKNLNVNLNKEIEASLSKIDFEKIEKQTEASLKEIDLNKIQQEVNISLQNAKDQIAQIDFSKMQNDMEAMQEKLKSTEFKSQFNSEKIKKEVDDAMNKAKESIEKAKAELQRMKDFTNELAADGLIDKKKGYTIQWKSGNLYINGKEQPKNISDKYREYENNNGGEIKMEPEGVEHF